MTPEQAIYDLISTAAGAVPVIFADESGPRPAKPYVALRVNPASRLPVHRGPVGGEGAQPVSAHRSAQVELQCFGAGCLDALDALGQRLHMQAALDRAEQLELAVTAVGQLQQVPVLRDATTYEPRAVLELNIGYTLSLTDTVGVIEEVNITGATDGGALSDPPLTIHASVE